MKKLKLTIIAFAIMFIALGGAAYASFPAKKAAKQEQTTKQQADEQTIATNENAQSLVNATETNNTDATAPNGLDEKWITLLLWLILGGFAAHRWYKKKPIGWNILYIVTAGGCGIWAIVDLVNILTDNF